MDSILHKFIRILFHTFQRIFFLIHLPVRTSANSIFTNHYVFKILHIVDHFTFFSITPPYIWQDVDQNGVNK